MFEKIKMWSKKKKIVVGVIIAFVLIGALGGGDNEEEPEEEAVVEGPVEEEPEEEQEEEAQDEPEEEAQDEPEDDPEEEPEEEMEGEKLAEHLIIETLGEETNMDNERIHEIDSTDLVLEIGLHGDENFTTNMTRDSMRDNTVRLSEVFYKEGVIEDIDLEIYWMLDLQDSHGNEVTREVLAFYLSQEDAEKVNWDNITNAQFEDLTLYFEHQIFD